MHIFLVSHDRSASLRAFTYQPHKTVNTIAPHTGVLAPGTPNRDNTVCTWFHLDKGTRTVFMCPCVCTHTHTYIYISNKSTKLAGWLWIKVWYGIILDGIVNEPFWSKYSCSFKLVPVELVNAISEQVFNHQTFRIASSWTWHYLRWYCIWVILVNIFVLVRDILGARWARLHGESIGISYWFTKLVVWL